MGVGRRTSLRRTRLCCQSLAGWVTTSSRSRRTWIGGRAWMSQWARRTCTSRRCLTCSTKCAGFLSGPSARRCACRFRGSTRSRASATCWRAGSNPCTGKVFTVEMHHTRADFANPGDNVGLNIKGLDKNNMPRGGDVMVYKKDTTLGQTREFDAQIQVLDIPNEIKVGYSPIGFVRCGRSACRISKLKWKMGKETGGKKMDDPHSLKSN